MNAQIKPHTAPDPTVATDRISHEPGKSVDVIAKTELIQITPGGERIEISAAIGSPYKTLDGFWRTPIRLRGLENPTPEVYAIDSMQSLYLAVEKVRAELEKLASAGGKLVDQQGDEISIAKYFKVNTELRAP